MSNSGKNGLALLSGLNYNKLNAIVFPNDSLPKFPIVWDFRENIDKSIIPPPPREDVMIVASLTNENFGKEVLEWKEYVQNLGYRITYSEITRNIQFGSRLWIYA